jgi:hypothetical protein
MKKIRFLRLCNGFGLAGTMGVVRPDLATPQIFIFFLNFKF